jgi:hypothetical protein
VVEEAEERAHGRVPARAADEDAGDDDAAGRVDAERSSHRSGELRDGEAVAVAGDLGIAVGIDGQIADAEGVG